MCVCVRERERERERERGELLRYRAPFNHSSLVTYNLCFSWGLRVEDYCPLKGQATEQQRSEGSVGGKGSGWVSGWVSG